MDPMMMATGSNETFASNVFVYLQCYFLTIAYILGTGILGLPVTLARAGLVPFIFMITLCLLMQAMGVYMMTESLQRLVAVQIQGEPPESEHLDGETGEDVQPQVNMFLLGKYFLPKVVGYVYIAHNLYFFCTCGTSYALAGSQAYAQVFNISSVVKVIPVFCWVLNVLAVFGRGLVNPLISVLTIFKGALLLVTVIMAFVVGASVHNHVTNDFRYVGDTFLMVTVALGGTYYSMPYLFSKIKFVEHEVRYFRLSVLAGLFTCYVLEILWCWAALNVVPQIDPCSVDIGHLIGNNSGSHCLPQDYTLLRAQENGEISTAVFSKVIQLVYPEYNWVALIVSLFIMVSITVSYLFNGAVLAHTVDGLVNSWWKESWNCWNTEKISMKGVVCSLTNLLVLAAIFTVTMFNPKSFIDVVKRLLSFAVNFGLGFYTGIIFWRCTSEKYSYLKIPLPLSKYQTYLQYLVSFFFVFASVYDIVMWILQSTGSIPS